MTLKVRRLEAVDLPVRVQWFNHPSVYTQMPLNVPMSLNDTQAWFARNALNERRRDFTFVNKAQYEGESAAVAMGGLVDIDTFNRRAELYLLVDPALTGRGIGRNALHWLCNYGFLELGLARIYLYTVDRNERARKFYEQSGFKLEGILRKHLFHAGSWCDRYIHGLLREEWETLSWRTLPPIRLEISGA